MAEADSTILPEAARYLQLAFGFTDHDLFCNREGYLSKTQRSALRLYIMDNSIGITLVTLSMAGLLALILTAINHEAHTMPICDTLPFAVVLTIHAIIWGQKIRKRWQNHLQDLSSGLVQQIDGEIRLTKARVGLGGAACCRVSIDTETLTAPEAALHKLHNGEHLRIYYAAASKIALSAEPLPRKRKRKINDRI